MLLFYYTIHIKSGQLILRNNITLCLADRKIIHLYYIYIATYFMNVEEERCEFRNVRFITLSFSDIHCLYAIKLLYINFITARFRLSFLYTVHCKKRANFNYINVAYLCVKLKN